MENTFTPGPWKMHPYFEGVYGPNGEFICLTLKPGMAAKPHTEANAKLIAAAPEMLEALELVNESLNKFFGVTNDDDAVDHTHDKVREAINKAKNG